MKRAKMLLSFLLCAALVVSVFTVIPVTASAEGATHVSQSKVLMPLAGEKSAAKAFSTLSADGSTEISVVPTASLAGGDEGVPEGTAYYVDPKTSVARNGATFDSPDVDFSDVYTSYGKTTEKYWYFESWIWVSDISKVGNMVIRFYPKGLNHTLYGGETVEYYIYQLSPLQNVDIDATVSGTQKMQTGWNHLKLSMSQMSVTAFNTTANAYVQTAARAMPDKSEMKIGGFSVHEHSAANAGTYDFAVAGARVVEADGLDADWGTADISEIYADISDVRTQFDDIADFRTDGLKVYKLLASGDTEEITDYTAEPASDTDSLGRRKVIITYTENGETYVTYYYLKSNIFTAFCDSDNTGWVAASSGNTYSIDTEDYAEGTASTVLTTTSSGAANAMLTYTGDIGHEAYAAPGDKLVFWMKVNDIGRIGQLIIEISHTHFYSPSTRFLISDANLNTILANNEWRLVEITIPAAEATTAQRTVDRVTSYLGGSVYSPCDYSHINYIRFYWQSSGVSESAPLVAKVNGLKIVSQNVEADTDYTTWNSAKLDAGWEVSGGSVSFDASDKMEGEASWAVTPSAANSLAMLIWRDEGMKGRRIDMSGSDYIQFWLYVENPDNLTNFTVEASNNNDYTPTNYRWAYTSNGTTTNNTRQLKAGWNLITLDIPGNDSHNAVTYSADGNYQYETLQSVDFSSITYFRMYFINTDASAVKYNGFKLGSYEDSLFSNVFTDGAVLQQNQPVSLYGEATAGETVSVSIENDVTGAKITGETTADETGYWRFASDETVSGSFDSYTITAKSGEMTSVISDVLFGEVWVAGGQSNMEFMVSKSSEYDMYAQMERNPYIRSYVQASTMPETEQRNTYAGAWISDESMQSLARFSAVGYSYARGLFEELNVPVGIITAAIGGAGIVAYLDKQDLIENRFELYDHIVRLGLTEGLIYNSAAGTPKYSRKSTADVPGAYYNSQVAPFKGYNARGIIWYQGCHDAARARVQTECLPVLIEQWSRVFSYDGNILPFIQFDLAPYGNLVTSVSLPNERFETAQAVINEKYGKTAYLVPNYDLWTDTTNIHPSNKNELALRAADIALANIYNTKEIGSGPEIESAVFKGDNAVITFKNAAEGLTLSKGTELAGFTYYDGSAYTALSAEITGGNEVTVYTADVGATTVYYAYGDEMLNANLANKEGYVSLPFSVTPDEEEMTVCEAEDITDLINVSNNWYIFANKNFSGKNALRTTDGGSVNFSFTGDKFSITSYTSSTQGSLYISVDGGEETEVSLVSGDIDIGFGAVVYTSDRLAVQTHNVSIRAEGKAYIDAVNIRGGELVQNDDHIVEFKTFEAENNGSITFEGDWSVRYAWNLSGHNAPRTALSGKASFSYTGYDFKIMSYTSSTQGKLYVSVDGAEAVEIDLSAEDIDIGYQKIVYETSGTAKATHTVEIVAEGKVYIDAVLIDGEMN
ncbi:MAG: sialate O-acetylesterase [Acutalibacteraceae bacterium]